MGDYTKPNMMTIEFFYHKCMCLLIVFFTVLPLFEHCGYGSWNY